MYYLVIQEVYGVFDNTSCYTCACCSYNQLTKKKIKRHKVAFQNPMD